MGTCASNDECVVDGQCPDDDANECTVPVCVQTSAPYVCDEDSAPADGNECGDGGAGTCEGGVCVLPELPATCDPTAQGGVVPCATPELLALDCFLLGSGAPIPLDPVIEPSAAAFAGVPVDVTPTVTLNLPASLVCGFAAVVPAAVVYNSIANLDVAGATPAGIETTSFLGSPPSTPHGGVPFDFAVGCGNQTGACAGGFCNGGTTACTKDDDCQETGPGVVVPFVTGSPTSVPGTVSLTPSAAGAIGFSYGFDDIGAIIQVPALFANLCLGQIAEDNGPPTPPGGFCGFTCVSADRTGDSDTSDPNDSPRIMYDAECDKAGVAAGTCEPFFEFSQAANVCATGHPGSALADTEAPTQCGSCQKDASYSQTVALCSATPGNGDVGTCSGTNGQTPCPNGDSDCVGIKDEYCVIPCGQNLRPCRRLSDVQRRRQRW
jgi:hypothetical protein